MSIHEEKELWLVVNTTGKIINTWCSCMAGTSRCYNHVIAALYKFEHANTHGYNDPSCTSIPCQWNQATKKDVIPRKITDIIVRRVRTKYKSKEAQDEESREEKRLQELFNFDPGRNSHRNKTGEHMSQLFESLKASCPGAVLFKSIEGLSVTSKSSINILDIANKIITFSNAITDDQKISQFLKHLTITEAQKVNVEKITCKQTDCAAWK